MKPFFPWLAGAILLASCDKANDSLAPMTDSPPAFRASQFMENIVSPLDRRVFVACAIDGLGEWVHLTGNLHSLFHVTLSSSGNFTLKQQFQPQGVRGTGETSGDKYQGTGATQQPHLHSGRVGQVYTFLNNFRIIGQGRGNNLLVHQLVHFTVNANGSVTSFVDNFSSTCK